MVQSRNEAYKNSVKIVQKFTVRPGEGAVAPSPPEYAATGGALCDRTRWLVGLVRERCVVGLLNTCGVYSFHQISLKCVQYSCEAK